MSNSSYVYEHVRPDTNLPFYVGMGGTPDGHRWAHDFKKNRNKRHKDITAELNLLGLMPKVRIIAVGLGKKAAFVLKNERIAHWRSLGLELVNMTFEEYRAIMRAIPIYPETAAKISAAAKARAAMKRQHANPEP